MMDFLMQRSACSIIKALYLNALSLWKCPIERNEYEVQFVTYTTTFIL